MDWTDGQPHIDYFLLRIIAQATAEVLLLFMYVVIGINIV